MISITEKEFVQLAAYIKANYGINLKEEKRALINGRLQNILAQNGFESFSDYYDYVMENKAGDAVATLVDKLTTNHTFFMREPDHFRYFRDNVLHGLVNSLKIKDLRIWSAGCSTGEEPFTLAMIIDDMLGLEKPLWDSKLLATDLSGKVLDTASKGIYGSESVSVLPAHWRLNYFKKLDEEKYMVADKIRNEVIFRKFNLMEPVFPFRRKFHVIFCRNVMIYFDNETKNRLVEKFYDHMENGGYLFIGHSESLNREAVRFRYVMPAVYRKE